MIPDFKHGRVYALIAAFTFGATLTVFLLPQLHSGNEAKIYESRIKELEARIARRDKALKALAVSEQKLLVQMRLSGRKSGAIEAAAEVFSRETVKAGRRLAALKKKGKENEPLFKDSPDDSDLVIRLERLLSGMGRGEGNAG